MQIWRFNLREGSLKRESVPESWSRLGGRGLLARILLDEVISVNERTVESSQVLEEADEVHLIPAISGG